MNKFAKALLLAVVIFAPIVTGTTVQAKSGIHRSKVTKTSTRVHRQYSSTHHARKRTESSTTSGS